MKRNFQWILFFGILALLVPSINANSAEFSEGRHSYCAMHLDGQIRKGDLEKYKIAAKKYHDTDAAYDTDDLESTQGKTICLNSPGGNLSEAILFSEHFLKIGIGTVVGEDEACLSACAFIFMVGRFNGAEVTGLSRKLHYKAKLGFHRPALTLDRSKGYDYNSVELAFDTAIDSVVEFIRIGNTHQPWKDKPIIASDLIKAAFEKKGSNFYFIDDINKIGRWDIELIGVAEKKYPKFGKEQAWNVCENTLTWQARLHKQYLSYFEALEYSTESVKLISRDIDEITFSVIASGSGQVGAGCTVKKNNGNKYIGICGYDDNTSTIVGERECGNKEFDQFKAIYVSNFAMLDPRTKIRYLDELPILPDIEILKQCTVIRNGKPIDRDICKYSGSENEDEDIFELFEWPSGSKTILLNASKGQTRINGVHTQVVYGSIYGSCYPNSKTGNQFCYLSLK